MIERIEDGATPEYSCKSCGKRMTNRSKMRRHVEVHFDMNLPCAICHKIFKTRNALSQHYNAAHKGEVLSPWTMSWLVLHLEIKTCTNHGTDTFILDFNFVLETMIERCSAEEYGAGVYMCKVCEKKMPNRTKIKRHAEVHLDINHPCNICFKPFKTRNALSQHYSTTHGQTVSHSQI